MLFPVIITNKSLSFGIENKKIRKRAEIITQHSPSLIPANSFDLMAWMHYVYHRIKHENLYYKTNRNEFHGFTNQIRHTFGWIRALHWNCLLYILLYIVMYMHLYHVNGLTTRSIWMRKKKSFRKYFGFIPFAPNFIMCQRVFVSKMQCKHVYVSFHFAFVCAVCCLFSSSVPQENQIYFHVRWYMDCNLIFNDLLLLLRRLSEMNSKQKQN